MKYKGVLARLQSYKPPADWAANVFLLPEPVNVKVLLEYAGVDAGRVDVVVDRLGYNWYLADLIYKPKNSKENIEVWLTPNPLGA